jgi:predicted DNA-binding protein
MPRRPILKDSRVVQLVFERELYERLKEAAMRQGRSISSLVREAVTKYLESLADGVSLADPPRTHRIESELGRASNAATEAKVSRAGGGLSNEGEVDQ